MADYHEPSRFTPINRSSLPNVRKTPTENNALPAPRATEPFSRKSSITADVTESNSNLSPSPYQTSDDKDDELKHMTNTTEQQAKEEASDLPVDRDIIKGSSLDAVSSGLGVGQKDAGGEDSQAGDFTGGEWSRSASDENNDEEEEEAERDLEGEDNGEREEAGEAGEDSGEESDSGEEDDEREKGSEESEGDREAGEGDDDGGNDGESDDDNLFEDEEQDDGNVPNNSNEPQNSLDNEITVIPKDANLQTVFVRVSYTFTPSLEEVEWSPHLLQFPRDTTMEDFKTELERYMIAKLRKQEPDLYRSMQTNGSGYYYIFEPSLISEDPVERHAFEFEGGRFPRVSYIEDFFPDPGNLRPELKVQLTHWHQILMKDLPRGSLNPVVSIEFRGSEHHQYFRMGTTSSDVKEPANVTEAASELPETLRRVKSLYLLSWKVPCHQDSITEKSLVLVKLPAWKLRQFLICDTKHSEAVPLKEFPNLDIDFDNPKDKRTLYSTLQSRFTQLYNDSSERPNDFRMLDADRLFYCFNTFPPAGLSVAGLPDLTIIALRFVSHLSESNARTGIKFESHQSLCVEETDDYIYPQVRERVMKALNEQKKPRAFLKDLKDRNASWDVQLWVLPQGRLEDQTYTLFRFHEENRLCDFLHPRHFGNEDFRLFMEVHLVPVNKKGEQMTTKRGRSISMKTQR